MSSHRLFAPIVLVMLLCAGCTNVPRINPAELYVLATTPVIQGRSAETRVSYDGRRWSAPNYPRSSSGTPIAARTGVPAGIGVNFERYLLAFFGPTGTLHTQESVNGLTWTNEQTHGTFSVDQHSRPSVAYDSKTSRWYVAFRRSNGSVFVRSFSARDGQGASANIVPDVSTNHAIGFAITDTGLPSNAVHSKLLLAYREGGRIRIKEALDPENWPAGNGTDTGLGSESGPFLSSSFGLIRLALAGVNAGTGPDHLSHGTVSVSSATDDSWTSWERDFSIDGGTTSAAFSPAFAGPRTATVAAKGNDPLLNVSTWFSNGNSRTIRGLPALQEIETQTGLDVSLAFGQDGEEAARALAFTLVFQRFHRGVPERDTEDVTLEVEHYGVPRVLGDDSTRPLVARMTPWEEENVPMNATVQFSIRGGFQPRFPAVMQEGDRIVVKMTGDDGTVSKVLDFADITAARRTQGDSSLRADLPGNRISYTVFFLVDP